MDSNQISAASIAEQVRAGALDPRALNDHCVERISRLNKALNALVAATPDRMQSALRALDVSIQPEAATLAGAPFVVSESVALAGAPHTSGSRYRQGEIAEGDATAVTRVLERGAIPLGVANTAEVGFSVETTNRIYGATGSPYNRTRIAGGSLGGAAALVATGCASFGLGIDMTGSARLAAQACGVVGLKPTGGLVPLTGFEPFPTGRMRRFACMSVVSRAARDLEPILRAIAGPDGFDGAALNFELRIVADYELLWKNVLVCDDMGLRGIPASREVRRAVHAAAEILGERGAQVEDWRPRQFDEAFLIWLAMVHEGYGFLTNFQSSITCGEDVSWLPELLKLPFRRSRHTAPVLAMGIVEKLTRTSLMRTYRLAAEGRRLKERLSILLNGGGLLLLPVFPDATPRRVRTFTDFRKLAYSSLINTLEMPSVTVPVARGSDGMPIAVQIVAAHGREDACIAAAIAIEESVEPMAPPASQHLMRVR